MYKRATIERSRTLFSHFTSKIHNSTLKINYTSCTNETSLNGREDFQPRKNPTLRPENLRKIDGNWKAQSCGFPRQIQPRRTRVFLSANRGKLEIVKMWCTVGGHVLSFGHLPSLLAYDCGTLLSLLSGTRLGNCGCPQLIL